ncbi:MAG: hypothetical protein AAI978_00110 [Candidatus Hodgkinia cicadicola]
MGHTCKSIGEVLKREFVKRLVEGTLVAGNITHKNKEFMAIDIGYKHDARVYSDTMWNYAECQTGCQIKVYIEQIESQANETVVSRRLLDADEAWKLLIKAKLESFMIKGAIEAKVSDGYVVKVLGLLALLPYDLIDESLRSKQLVGRAMLFEVAYLDKLSGFIKLKLNRVGKGQEQEEDFEQDLLACEDAWGIISGVSERRITLDFCSQKTWLTVDSLSWHDIVNLISEPKLGQLIESWDVGEEADDGDDNKEEEADDGDDNKEEEADDGDDNKEEEADDEYDAISLLKFMPLLIEQQVIIFGIITKITRSRIVVNVTDDMIASASAKFFGVGNMARYMRELELELGDTISTLPIKVDCTGKKTLIDVDIDSACHHKYATLNEENTVFGIIVQAQHNIVMVILGYELYGVIETDTPEQAKLALELLQGGLVEFNTIDYDPELGVVYLQIVEDERTRACLVET